jgi:hypothetical protein
MSGAVDFANKDADCFGVQTNGRPWEMVQILERNGVYVKKIKTDRPGYVIYEDEWQLVAEPFRKGTMQRS